MFSFCPFRLCRAADGHDRSDQGAESQPGHPLFGVQTVCHTHVLPQGEKAYFFPCYLISTGTLTYHFSLWGLSTLCPISDFPLFVICRVKIHLGTFKQTVDV